MIYLISKPPKPLMKDILRIKGILFYLIIIINSGCSSENHIENNNIQIDSLKILPNSFYAFRRGRIFVENIKPKSYRIWYDIDRGGVENIYKIEDFQNRNNTVERIIAKYGIDTNLCKKNVNLFIRLSRKYEFGHLSIDQQNNIFFSNRDGLLEQYAYPFNDSVRKRYSRNSNFRLLQSGWFENIAD